MDYLKIWLFALSQEFAFEFWMNSIYKTVGKEKHTQTNQNKIKV